MDTEYRQQRNPTSESTSTMTHLNGAMTSVHRLHKAAQSSPSFLYIPCISAGTGRAEVVDEVIAQHPAPPLSPFAPGSRLAARGPVHNALTASTRSHFPGLSAAQQPAEAGTPGSECDDENPPKQQVDRLLVVLLLQMHSYCMSIPTGCQDFNGQVAWLKNVQHAAVLVDCHVECRSKCEHERERWARCAASHTALCVMCDVVFTFRLCWADVCVCNASLL